MKTAFSKVSVVLAALTLLQGCVGSVTRSSSFNVAPGKVVAPRSKVFILAVRDGGDPKDGAGSGAAVATAIRDKLLAKGLTPLLSDESTLKAGLAAAKEQGYAYVLRPLVTQFEDNNTPWSHKPDRGSLSVELYDTASGELAAAGTHNVVGPTQDPVDLKPVRFIPELVDTCLGTLFGWPPTVKVER
jgi:hypothetical protein